MPIKSLETEEKTGEELIRGWIKDYDPKAPTNSQLLDDFRICLAWYSSLLEGRKLFKRVGKEERRITLKDCVDLGTKIVREMIRRRFTFNKPESYKPGARKAFEEIIKRIGKDKIPWKEKELTIKSPDLPMQPAIAITKRLLTDAQIRELKDDELKHYHDQLHIMAEVEAMSLDTLAKNHALVVDELKRRRLKHDFDPKNKLDLKSKTYEEEYPKPWLSELLKEVETEVKRRNLSV